jgi:hypothetical protein
LHLTHGKINFVVHFVSGAQQKPSWHLKCFHNFSIQLQMNKTLYHNCTSQKHIHILVRGFFQNIKLNMCFLFSIEYIKDTCETTRTYIYLLCSKFFYTPHTTCGTLCKIWNTFLIVWCI